MARPKKHETFLYRVYKKVRPTITGCFEFYGCLNEDGYGRINKNGKLVFVHREIWKEFNGDIPDGMCVCHRCDNPCCINHNHLFLGTHKQNMEDKARKGRINVSGTKNPSAKLCDVDVLEIKSRICKGDICYEIAREYGVTGEAILAIKNGRTWKHIS